MRTSPFAQLGVLLTSLIKGFACRLSKPNIEYHLTFEQQHVKKATIFKDGLFILVEELAFLKVKPQLVGASSPALPMENFSLRLVWSLQPKRTLRNAGVWLQSNNTAELSSTMEASSVPGP